MKFTLTIDTENAAFVDNPDDAIAHALFEVRCEVMNQRRRGVVVDANGNRVGEWRIEG